jgi:hypothetical protein
MLTMPSLRKKLTFPTKYMDKFGLLSEFEPNEPEFGRGKHNSKGWYRFIHI